MRYANHRVAIDELSASEGVFTVAQAARYEIPRNSLSRAVSSGRAKRVAHGAYRFSSTASLPTDELSTIWKLTSPSRLTSERIGRRNEVSDKYRTARALEMAVKESAKSSPMVTGKTISGFYFHRFPCRVF